MLVYEDLDGHVRQCMLEELRMDIEKNRLYLSPRLSERGRQDYPGLLTEAIRYQGDAWLESELRRKHRLNRTEECLTADGTAKTVAMPEAAAEAVAEGEFNRYYARGVCRAVVESGQQE